MVQKAENSRNSETYVKRKPKHEILIPLSIFQQRPLTILESLVLHLRNKERLRFLQISKLLNRERRNIKKAYFNAKSKHPEEIKISAKAVPASIFSDTKLSALEAVVWCLKEEFSLSYHEIAVLLKRDDRTIWTVYQRARKKNVKSK